MDGLCCKHDTFVLIGGKGKGPQSHREASVYVCVVGRRVVGPGEGELLYLYLWDTEWPCGEHRLSAFSCTSFL